MSGSAGDYFRAETRSVDLTTRDFANINRVRSIALTLIGVSRRSSVALPTFQFPVVDEEGIVGLPGRISRHLTVARAAVRALLLQHVVAAVRRVGDR